MDQKKKIHLLGMCGSLRKESYNLKLMHAIEELLPENVTLTIADLGALPHYNNDLENDLPESVLKLIEQAKVSDALIITTPEYNYSIPGMLKNGLDWLSRQFADWPLRGKPAAVTGASTGTLGTVRAQLHLRDILFAFDMEIARPEVYVGHAQQKFDDDGRLIDEPTREFVQMLIDNLIETVGNKA